MNGIYEEGQLCEVKIRLDEKGMYEKINKIDEKAVVICFCSKDDQGNDHEIPRISMSFDEFLEIKDLLLHSHTIKGCYYSGDSKNDYWLSFPIRRRSGV